MSVFKRKGTGVFTSPLVNNIINTLEKINLLRNTNLDFNNNELSKTAFSMESASDIDVNNLFRVATENSNVLENIAQELNFSDQLNSACYEAASAAGIIANNPTGFFGLKRMKVATEGVDVVDSPPSDAFMARDQKMALEAYDERSNSNVIPYSIVYNMHAPRQDTFAETLFPTLVISPDQVGIDISIDIAAVIDDVRRSITGAVDNFNRKNIIRAAANPNILKNDGTKVIPVYRVQSADKFVSSTVIPPRDLNNEGEVIPTAPLAFGVEFSLLGLSATDAILATGTPDITDTLDPGMSLDTLYMKVGADVIKLPVNHLPYITFTETLQHNNRDMNLNFKTDSIVLTEMTKNVDGSALVDLAAIVTQKLRVRLSISVSGDSNIETSNTRLFANKISVYKVENEAGESLSLSTGVGKAISDLFPNNSSVLIGYDLKAYRTNINHRQRLQLITTQRLTQRYLVYLRAPIAALHPINADSSTEATSLATLITATRYRTTASAVGELLETANRLADFKNYASYTADSSDVDLPNILGFGRYLVIPTYFEEDIDLRTTVDSLNSTERAADIQNALLNKVRDYAYQMYTSSEYSAAAEAMGIVNPTIIVATDPIISKYLMITGDMRTLSTTLNMKIVETIDYRMKGKIFITFGVFDETKNSAPNPLHFGNMIWSPEITAVLPITRNGQISRELTVQPRYHHFTNLPVLTQLRITNIPDVLDKLPITVNQL